MKIAFHQPHLSERGTTVAMFDYAYYNEVLLNNESIIITQKNHQHTNENMYNKFNKFFKIFEYNDFHQEVDNILRSNNVKYIYHIKYGTNDNLLSKIIPNLNHFVFECEPHGEKYAMVSDYLADRYSIKSVPHIVNRYPFTKKQHDDIKILYRNKYNIPQDAFVYGRYGGKDTFSIDWAKQAVINVVNNKSNIYFLFLNTNIFYSHPKIIYLTTMIDDHDKNSFIAACDAMIHARLDGETFGLSIAEFSVANKPVLTTYSYKDNCHIELLGSKAVIYKNQKELEHNLANPLVFINKHTSWNAYKLFSPEIIMDKFQEVFLK
jgi:hypothetical protein